MSAFVYVLIFLAVFLTVEGLLMLWNEGRSGSRAVARKRLQQIAMGIQDPRLQPEDSILRARQVAGRSLTALTNWLPGGAQLERRLYQAGLQISPSRFVLLVAALGIGAWLAASIALNSAWLALPFLAVGALPFARIQQLRNQRLRKFEEQFPEALDLITRALRAGNALLFGFQMVGDELPDPVGSEFAQVTEEIKLGQEQRIALGNMAYRMEGTDLPFFVTAVTIQRETGGNLAEVFEKLGRLIRERFALYGKVRALTAVGKASANLLALMPALMVVLLYSCGGKGGREYIEPLFTTRPGFMIAGLATTFVVIGYVLCRRLARIEV